MLLSDLIAEIRTQARDADGDLEGVLVRIDALAKNVQDVYGDSKIATYYNGEKFRLVPDGKGHPPYA